MNHLGTIAEFQEKKEIRVKQYFRNGKIVRASRRKIDKAKLQENNIRTNNNAPIKEDNKQGGIRDIVSNTISGTNTAVIATGATIATGIGVSAGSYVLLKNKYVKNLNEFAKTLKPNPALGKKFNPKVEHITFAFGGFVGKENVKNGSTRVASHIASMIPASELNKHAILPIDHGFSPTFKYGNEGALKKLPEFFKNSVGFASGKLFSGKNDEARKTSELLLSYAAKNPGKQINIVGHSGGGILAKEVAYILQKKGVKVKYVTAANPDLRILPTNDPNQLGFMTDTDFTSPFTKPGSVRLKASQSRSKDPHSQVTYFENSTLRKKLVSHLYGYDNAVQR